MTRTQNPRSFRTCLESAQAGLKAKPMFRVSTANNGTIEVRAFTANDAAAEVTACLSDTVTGVEAA